MPCAAKARTVVHCFAARATGQRTAVNPEKDRRVAGIGGRPDIQGQAIFAHRQRIARIDGLDRDRGLIACGPEFRRLPDLRPLRHGSGRLPTRWSHRGQRIRDALEDAQRAFQPPFDFAGGGVHDGTAVWRCGWERRAESEAGERAEAKRQATVQGHWTSHGAVNRLSRADAVREEATGAARSLTLAVPCLEQTRHETG
jgi:hypothetical protein